MVPSAPSAGEKKPDKPLVSKTHFLLPATAGAGGATVGGTVVTGVVTGAGVGAGLFAALLGAELGASLPPPQAVSMQPRKAMHSE